MSNDSRFMRGLAVAFAAIFAVFCLWQSPGLIFGPLTKAEIDRALTIIDKTLYLPPQEKAQTLERLQKWAKADDGRPVYMLNLMRFHDEVQPPPGAPAFNGTPQEANAIYERKAMPMLFAAGDYPIFGSQTQGENILTDKTIGDGLGRVLVVRYSSRRDFLKLVTDPAYATIEPYKLMALQVALTPTSGDVVVPDARLALGALLLIAFLSVGWFRSARRKPALAPALGLARAAAPVQMKVKESL